MPLRSPIDDTTLAKIRRELESPEAALRAQAVEALGALGDRYGLIDALASDDAYVRRAAVRGLADHPGERLTWRIAQTRFDGDEGVRSAVALALARRTSWLVAHTLRRMVEQDDSANVRFHALVGLGAIDSPRIDEVLRAVAANDAEPRLRDMAAALLRRREPARGRGPGDPPREER